MQEHFNVLFSKKKTNKTNKQKKPFTVLKPHT